ncbi:MAG: FAD-dependent thymidylate synthase [Acidobacteriota bacterium]|nr:FAD-dependent thymidylate synthase [Blastocatellia bacterium]MDW8411591.1 FAD-dependent thymidylate synthase [Acidobacteriota bacterium]
MKFLSAEPIVKLEKVFTNPFHNAIATARTCYSSKGLVHESEITEANYQLAEDIYKAGHHTVLGHAHLQFSVQNVSRQFIWSFLHSHPHYNSEQVSQRYVAVKSDNVAIPPLEGQALDIYLSTIELQMAAYQKLTEILLPVVTSEYLKIFPHHDPQQKRQHLRRKAMEAARYVLPIATLAYLYHTISVLTLLRYYRLCSEYDAPLEQQIVVQGMVSELLTFEPLYERLLEDPLPLEATPEGQFFMSRPWDAKLSEKFREEFDRELDGKMSSRLIDYKVNNEAILAQAVREVLGQPRTALSDDEAIELVLDPAKNRLLGETLNLQMMSKLGRTMHHPAYTFKRRLSHTADSQDQRHRMTPASRPVLAAHLSDTPDYTTPKVIEIDPASKKLYTETMAVIWENITKCRKAGASDEFVAYLLPNAVNVRYTESADLMGLHHKHRMRLCYLAQEELWRATLEEVEQIRAINPRIGKYLLPPCTQRWLARVRPTCPEGERFCGVPVWKLDLSEYRRII